MWDRPLGSVFDLDDIPDQRDHRTACTMTCYPDTSTMMHAGIAVGDGAMALVAGRVGDARCLLFRRSVALSLGAVGREAGLIARLARRRKQRPPGPASAVAPVRVASPDD